MFLTKYKPKVILSEISYMPCWYWYDVTCKSR